MSLLALQRDFRGWLTAESPEAATRLGDGPGLAVYLNTYRAQLMACLAESYPILHAWLGDAAFEGACATHIDDTPPHGWTLDDIERVELTGHPLLRERTDRPGVRTGRESQVSAQHAVAVTLKTGKAGLAQFSDSAVADPLLRAFDTRLQFIDDASWPVESAQVAVVLRSGETLTRHIQAARGSLAAPLTDVELAEKLRDLAAYGGSGVSPQPLIDTLWRFDSENDSAALMRLACPG